MKIGEKLLQARKANQMNQEEVADRIFVSRQTISNWENEKSYPDIISIIKLSDLYHISLDDLLKGDESIMAHLAESTDVVKSNSKLILYTILNILMYALVIIFNTQISENKYLLFACLSLLTASASILFYQIIRKF
jgi:Predicted transcriptional regulators